ncbi:MAG: glutathione S-transferase family protein [Myxococcales bacterium]|nr:glutathione S-transferase family protein [Myxococcales bacterium]MCB9525219.1 glutathione S-transferase family protein [Myxococcales bacterium]
MARYELVSFHLCPYVQKAAIALRARGVDYDITYIDLSDKPDWFLAISPYGKVPLLRVGDDVIFESTVINEFIEETTEGPALLSTDPIQRAKERSWVAYGSDLNLPVYRLMVAEDAAEAGSEAKQVRDHMARLESNISEEGPWFMGDRFTLADAATAPPLQRLLWIDALAPRLRLFKDAPLVRAWASRLVEHPAVRASTVDDIHARFVAYLKGDHGVNAQEPPSWLVR